MTIIPVATARITVLLTIAESKSGDAEKRQEFAEWAIDDMLSRAFREDPLVTGWRIIGDWPETPDIFTMSDPLGAP